MSEIMNISVNGQSQVPPGFRFHPTEEELLHYYLRKKISHLKIDLDVIHEVDLNKLEPWDIQARCKIGTTTQTDWYFFSHKDKKYPSGTRTNRATTAGFWKATGRDKVIYKSNSRSQIIGMRKTLVFYTGRAPNGQKSDWIMYEYRLDDSQLHIIPSHDVLGETQHDEGWVVCRIFKKRNHQQQIQDYPNVSASINVEESRTQQMIPNSPWDHEDEEEEKKVNTNSTMNFQQFEAMMIKGSDYYDATDQEAVSDLESSKITKWEAVDQLVACQLNGKTEEGIFCDISHFGGYFLY